VIVEVDKPYVDVTPGSRPPLIKGLFVEVHLLGAARPDSLVVPRSALHDNHLYLVNDQNRLVIKKVQVKLYQPEFAIVSNKQEASNDGIANHLLAVGDSIIISDLVPAIEGMLLSPQADQAAEKRLKELVFQTKVKGNQ